MFEDIIGTKQVKESEVCKKCGSTDIEVSQKIYNNKVFDGVIWHPTDKGSVSRYKYKKYKQFVRCYACNKKYIKNGTEILYKFKKRHYKWKWIEEDIHGDERIIKCLKI
jgi:hypothetical protein